MPAHYSHVLQPLDLGVFNSLKNRYRNLLNAKQTKSLEESSIVIKRLFLECYRITMLEGLSKRNIQSGWKAGGLWPINMTKPLMSRHLIKNNNSPAVQSGPQTPITPLSASGATLEDYGYVVNPVTTSRKQGS